MASSGEGVRSQAAGLNALRDAARLSAALALALPLGAQAHGDIGIRPWHFGVAILWFAGFVACIPAALVDGGRGALFNLMVGIGLAAADAALWWVIFLLMMDPKAGAFASASAVPWWARLGFLVVLSWAPPVLYVVLRRRRARSRTGLSKLPDIPGGP